MIQFEAYVFLTMGTIVHLWYIVVPVAVASSYIASRMSLFKDYFKIIVLGYLGMVVGTIIGLIFLDNDGQVPSMGIIWQMAYMSAIVTPPILLPFALVGLLVKKR